MIDEVFLYVRSPDTTMVVVLATFESLMCLMPIISGILQYLSRQISHLDVLCSFALKDMDRLRSLVGARVSDFDSINNQPFSLG